MIPWQYAKNLIDHETVFLMFAFDNILKMKFGLNHYKCTGHTSNKMDFISLDIISIEIDERI